MIKYNSRDIKQRKIFATFYEEYITELSKYSERLRELSKEDIQDDITNISANSLLKKYFITNETNTPIGFCLIGFDENTQPGTDWFIAEFYIQHGYRKKGYGQKAVEKLFQRYPGKYCYFVLKSNKPAQKFWNKIRKTFNCKDTKDQYVCSCTPEDCTFEAFEKY